MLDAQGRWGMTSVVHKMLASSRHSTNWARKDEKAQVITRSLPWALKSQSTAASFWHLIRGQRKCDGFQWALVDLVQEKGGVSIPRRHEAAWELGPAGKQVCSRRQTASHHLLTPKRDAEDGGHGNDDVTGTVALCLARNAEPWGQQSSASVIRRSSPALKHRSHGYPGRFGRYDRVARHRRARE